MDATRGRQLAPHPLAVVVAEGGAGDDREALLAEAGDGEVALDAAAVVQHLGVGDLADVAGDAVVAEAFEVLGRRRPGDLELGEGGLVEQRRRLAGGAVLGPDRRRPVLAGPAAGAQLLLAAGGVGLEPVDPLPARLFAEGGAVLTVPGVDRRDPQRPPGAALVVGVADVVVGLVVLADPGVGVGGGAVLGAEAADVHVPEVEARLPLGDPLGHHFADPAGAGEAVGAEAGADEEAADLALAETELVVGGEGLGAVDQLRHGDLVHRRDPALGVLDDLLHPLPVLFQQPPVEVGWDLLDAPSALWHEGGRALPLVATHDEPVPVLPVVDEEIRVAQRRQVSPLVVELFFAIRGKAQPRRISGFPDGIQRLRHQVLVGEGDQGDADAGHPGDLGRVHAARVDDDLRGDVTAIGPHAADAAVADLDPGHPGRGEDPAAALAGAIGERVG